MYNSYSSFDNYSTLDKKEATEQNNKIRNNRKKGSTLLEV